MAGQADLVIPSGYPPEAIISCSKHIIYTPFTIAVLEYLDNTAQIGIQAYKYDYGVRHL